MRQIFSSHRIENVEGVARLLREHDIEVKITDGRGYRGRIRGNFSYRDQPGEGQAPAAVWVVKSEDQPKARELLREAGLLDSTRSPTSFLPTPTMHRLRGEEAGDAAKRRAFRFRVALLLGIAMAMAFVFMAIRAPVGDTDAGKAAAKPAPGAVSARKDEPAAAEAGGLTTIASADRTFVIATPKALAAMLVGAELAAQPARRLCLTVDGVDPEPAQLEALRVAPEVRVAPASQCVQGADGPDTLGLRIGEYRTDGSGTGTIRVEIADTGADGKLRVEIRTLEVQRDNDERWRVLRVVP